MNNNQILETALKQSALEANCRPDDFLSKENKVVFSAFSPKARIYLALPLYCNLISYGNNIVASPSVAGVCDLLLNMYYLSPPCAI